MFKNIGKKIKGLAAFVCWVGIILSAIAGILMIVSAIQENEGFMGILPGVAVIVGGFLASWIGSFAAYGFGELIDKTAEIA